ncbi:thioredoxin family protein [Phycicoccus flavus]|uniref:Thioredoxin family protein n=1 Tax=Phycicoccus flavus TaxID=2502783 RepID=A0A8T6QXM6_9MICO|nr:thioredoxin family protein [Phycicoccus flavus]NHA66529.1 thioredoxin family protein [Phycicoccus flavus]
MSIRRPAPPRPVRTAHAGALAAAAVAALLAGCGSAATDTGGAAPTPAAPSPSAPADTPTAGASPATDDAGADSAAPGAYVTYEDYEADPGAHAGTTVVYFFHAPWCPSCRATEEAVRTSGVPAGLTLVKVDFDSATALRQEYGVTTQHTFVQVAPDGSGLKTWTGSSDGAAILAETV